MRDYVSCGLPSRSDRVSTQIIHGCAHAHVSIYIYTYVRTFLPALSPSLPLSVSLSLSLALSLSLLSLYLSLPLSCGTLSFSLSSVEIFWYCSCRHNTSRAQGRC